MRPAEIEQASMAIIAEEMGEWAGNEEDLPVVKRVVHTTADFDFVQALRFSEGAVARGRAGIALFGICSCIYDYLFAASSL